MELKTQHVIRVLCTIYFLYTTADSDAYDNIKGKVSAHNKASYFDTMPRMDTSWEKAPKKVTLPLTVHSYLPFLLRNGPTGSPYFEGLSYFGWCFAVTYVAFRHLWYLKVACDKRCCGIQVVKMEGKIGFVFMLLMAIMVMLFAITGLIFTVDTIITYTHASQNGRKAVFNIATTTWNKLDIIAWELGQMAKFLKNNPNVGNGMTEAKAEKLQKSINNDKKVLDTDKYDNLIKQINDKFTPTYRKYAAFLFFPLLAVFVILSIFRNHGRCCSSLNSLIEPVWYFFMVILVLISTFTIFGNDLCKDVGAPGIVAEQAFILMNFDVNTSNLMGGFYKYYFVCDGKTDHPLTNLMELDAGNRNLGEKNPLDGTLIGNLLSTEEEVDVNQMLKEKPEMKENFDNCESFFKENPEFKKKLGKAKSLDEMLDITETIADNPSENKELMKKFNKLEMKFVSMQMHLMSQMAKFRVDTDCKTFIDDIKKVKTEACEGLNDPVVIIAMIIVLMTMDFIVIIVQNVYSWCKSRESAEPVPAHLGELMQSRRRRRSRRIEELEFEISADPERIEELEFEISAEPELESKPESSYSEYIV